MFGPEGGMEPAVPDDYLLDAETKADIAKRAQLVGEVGVCLGSSHHPSSRKALACMRKRDLHEMEGC